MKLKELIPIEPEYFYNKYNVPAPESREANNLASILGVGALTALTGVVSNPELTFEQKKQILIIVFGIDDAAATKLAGEPKTETDANNETE